MNGVPPQLDELKRRIEKVRRIIIRHPKYQQILNRLEEVLMLSQGSVSPESLFIYGSTGVGKSTVTSEFKDRYPRVEMVTPTHRYTSIPVLHVRVPPKATPKALASKILYVMGDPYHDKGSESQLTSRIHRFIKELRIQMIILDEFQHLIDSDTDHVLTTASNWVKTFTEESTIPIVLCGMPESVNIFAKNPQLDRRYCTKESMQEFQYNNADEITEFRVFLHKVEAELPFAEPSHLADPRLSDKLFYISRGIPFYVMKLLEIAAIAALKNGDDKISEAHLEKALTNIKQISRPFRVNPFNNSNFNINEELKSESAAEDRFKLELLGEKQRRRKSKLNN